MTIHSATPVPVEILPENAPFSAEQRSWLNGFFAGLLSPGNNPSSVTTLDANDAARIAGAGAEEEEAPWHDPSMEITERMKLADGKPLQRRMFAAMAQQDCGQCGYLCATYSAAVAEKREPRLNLCSPGGKETFRMLKTLAVELDAAGATPAVEVAAPAVVDANAEPSRENPAQVAYLSRRRLNKGKSEKHTYHIEFNLSGSGLTYVPGDSFGIYPRNDARLADAIIALLGARPDAQVNGKSLHQCLVEDCALGPAPDSLFQLFSYMSGGETRRKAQALASGEDPDGDLDRLDILGALHKFSGLRPGAEAFVEALDPLQPRLYSISSSPRMNPTLLSLTVDTVRYRIGQRERLGVASTYLGERVADGEPIRAFIQKAHAFALPADPNTPIIMVGPGTGVAPFRAFLHDRAAADAPGKNWLFFGHQHRESDFFYEDELEDLRTRGKLQRLTLAWSRDAGHKIYVQDRMRETGTDLWRWFEEGAHFYICGDAKRMAKDVERALVDIATQHGAMTTDNAVAWVASLKKAQRFQADVY
jgi:sulfite reductase (NADPH) flavoprotein alpha-component